MRDKFQKIVDGLRGFVNHKAVAADIEDVRRITAGSGVHEVLPYEFYDQDTGLFYNDNSMGFCLLVNPQSGVDEDIIGRLNTMYSTIPANYGLQWSMFGSSSLADDFDDYVNLRVKNLDKVGGMELFTQLAKQKSKHINKTRGRPMWLGSNYSIKKSTLILSISTSAEFKNRARVEELLSLRESLTSNLKSAYFYSETLKPEGLIRFLWMLLNPECMFDKEVRLGDIGFDVNKLIKNQLTELGRTVTVKSKDIIFGELDDEGKPYRLENDERICARTLGVQRYPNQKALWEMEKAIGDFDNNTLQYPCPYLINMGVYFLARNDTEK